MNQLTTTDRRPLTQRFAEQYGIEPNRMLETLKQTCFKTERGISNEQMAALLIVAEQHGLNPFTKEMHALVDKQGGVIPFIGYDGWVRKVNQHPMFNGVHTMFEGAGQGLSCTVTMYRKDRDLPTVVSEYLSECKRNSAPWQSHPRRMLRNRTYAQCARMAFGFAGLYEPDEAAAILDARERMTGGAQVQPQHLSRSHAALQTVEEVPRTAPPVERFEEPSIPSSAPQPDQAPYMGKTLAIYMHDMLRATDGETAMLVLDEARSDLSDDQLAELASAYYLKWQPPAPNPEEQ